MYKKSSSVYQGYYLIRNRQVIIPSFIDKSKKKDRLAALDFWSIGNRTDWQHWVRLSFYTDFRINNYICFFYAMQIDVSAVE